MARSRLWRRDNTERPMVPVAVDSNDAQTSALSGPQPGECRHGICGEEAACVLHSNGMHTCLCPHDGSPPTKNFKCSRSTVPLTPRPIHNIIPPISAANTTQAAPQNSTTISTAIINKSSWPDAFPNLILLGVIGITALVVVVSLIVCYWKRKGLASIICKDKSSSKAEAPLTGEPLLAERYIANPQYSSGYGGFAGHGSCVPQLQRETLCFLDEIGEGCFGKVYKGELKSESASKTVAIKVLKDCAGRTAEDDFNREVNIMSYFQHNNILTLMGVVQRGDSGHNPWMVFEYMPFGDLAGVLRSNSHAMRQHIPGLLPLDNKSLLSIALQIACGMKYLAEQHFVHRDLACRNCLVGDGLTVKIADFGMSRDVYTSDYYKMGGNRPMPIRWMSPESIEYARFTLESDVWSYGVVLWEIYTLGKQPFYGHNNDEASKLILQGIMLIPPEDSPTFVCELMRSCWRTDPKNRIHFHDICDRLQFIQENGAWSSSDGSEPRDRENWSQSLIRKQIGTIGRLPRPPATLPVIAPCPPTPPQPAPHQLTDPEGYLLPTHPVLISDYITALPD